MRGLLRPLLFSTAIVTVVWALFAWPLPRHATTGIAYTSRLIDTPRVRHMVAGDHLQLLYHFWLAGDILRGQTPWMSNPYQFNMGIDAADRDLSDYYYPFSVVFAIGDMLLGHAFGWNLTGWLTLVLTFFFTWRLARRYSGGEWSAAAGALLGVILPYRWITLLGGSPTGFDMVLVPMLWLGLDLAIREGRRGGGVLAGLALWCTAGSDPHVFFFSALSVPAWALVALAVGVTNAAAAPNRPALWLPRARAWCLQGLRGLWPAALIGIAPLLITLHRSANLDATSASGGWHPRDVARYSPAVRGLWSWAPEGIGDQIFLGLAVPLLLVAGLLILWRRPTGALQSRTARLLVPGLLLIGIVGVVLLALGTNGPRNGVLMELVRSVIPPYRMVRQTAKIYCLLPTLLAVLGALAAAALTAGPRARQGRALVLTLLALGALEYRAQLATGVCLLDAKQAAYAAVADHATEQGVTARALALPLWPGQSHWASLNQHYASLFRIRMVNGYSPSVPKAYFEEVFQSFESGNQGAFDDAQLDHLQSCGIQWILLHEDAFPEQVSPFPSGVALARLLANPRLTLLARDEAIWAFEIQAATVPPLSIADPARAFYAPSRLWEFEQLRLTVGSAVSDASAGGGAAWALSPGESVRVAARGLVTPYPGLAFMARVRGPGTIGIAGDVPNAARRHTLAGSDWTWLHLPLTTTASLFTAAIQFTLEDGEAAFDMALLTAGHWSPPAPGQSVALAPDLFFHEGYTAPDDDALHLDADRPAAMGAWYGPRLPLEPGRYTVELQTSTEVAANTGMGWLRVATPDGIREAEILAGHPTRLTLDWPLNLPFTVRLDDSRAADLTITSVILHHHP